VQHGDGEHDGHIGQGDGGDQTPKPQNPVEFKKAISDLYFHKIYGFIFKFVLLFIFYLSDLFLLHLL